MGQRGMYLNKWTSFFYLEGDVPSIVLVWVRFPHIPLHCWNDESFKSIGNTLGKYNDKSDPN